MSIENHPNIQAVAFSMDILNSIRKNLRGKAKSREDEVFDGVQDLIVDFVADVSTKIDEVVGD